MSTAVLHPLSSRQRPAGAASRPPARPARAPQPAPVVRRVQPVRRVPAGPHPLVPAVRPRSVAPAAAAPVVVVGHRPLPQARRAIEAPAPVRLTRRGRLVVVVMMLALALAALTALGARSAATGESGAPVHTRTVEVGAGDTLWSIAADVAPAGQVRETVHEIRELNALTGPGLRVGQEIAVPVG